MKLKHLLLLLALAVTIAIALYFIPFNQELPTEENVPDKIHAELITGLETCAICGYDALDSIAAQCNNCQFILSQEEAEKEGLINRQSLLALRQTEYFLPDSLGQSIDFLAPVVSPQGYPKNPNWRPVVFESDIYEFQKALMMFEAYGDSVKASTEPPVARP